MNRRATRYLSILTIGIILPSAALAQSYNTTQTVGSNFKNDTVNIGDAYVSPFTVTFNGAFDSSTINGYEGTAIFNGDFKKSMVINNSGATLTFDGDIQTGAVVNISGGSATFNKDIQNGVVFNISGGGVEVNSVKNNATFNISGGDIDFTQSVGNNASVSLSGGTLLLSDNNIFSNNTDFTVSGGTIDTQGNSFAIDSLTLTGNATIDLGDNPNTTVNLGDLSGGGVLNVSGFTSASQIQYGSIDPNFNVSDQVFFGSTPGEIVNGVIVPSTPVPEPTTMLGGGLVLLALGFLEYRRQAQKAKAA